MKKTFLLFLLVQLCTLSGVSQSVSPFRNGERAVFLGNSITDGGHYHSFIWLYYMTRFPEMNVKVMNAGIGGDTAYDMYKRLDGDVFSKRPTSLIVTFGMNDSGYFEYNSDNSKEFGEKKYQECLNNFQLMEKRLQGLSNTNIIMMGGSPYDESAKIQGNTSYRGKNAVMQRIVAFQEKSAQENSWQFFDLNQPMTDINQKLQKQDSTFTICGNDRIHPENDGHMVMAYLFLKEQGFVGKKVADIEVNGARGTLVNSENCAITNIKKNGRNLITFDYLSNSLPYPLDTVPRGWNAKKSQSDAIKYIPFMEEMNQELLKVTGLKGNYRLMIDDVEIGNWTGEALSKGINLAKETKTPQYQQSLAIMHLNEHRWELERNFRDYAWIQFGFFQGKGLLFANNRESVEVMDKEVDKNVWLKIHRDNYAKMMHKSYREVKEKEMDLIVSTIYEINKPIVRKVSLQRLN